ncbi:MAG: DUF5674 family protein [Candidatus Magasanikbacteria bacterium]|nr:DUF5674 family protein [Candidatus Magasanikbacteria bacterium]
MIITKSEPYTKEEIQKLLEELDPYIKTVIDLDLGICCAGAKMHYEEEKILMDLESKQSSLWGGGVDVETKTIAFDSMINLRPNDNNLSNEILDPVLRRKFEDLTKHFFSEIYNK